MSSTRIAYSRFLLGVVTLKQFVSRLISSTRRQGWGSFGCCRSEGGLTSVRDRFRVFHSIDTAVISLIDEVARLVETLLETGDNRARESHCRCAWSISLSYRSDLYYRETSDIFVESHTILLNCLIFQTSGETLMDQDRGIRFLHFSIGHLLSGLRWVIPTVLLKISLHFHLSGYHYNWHL